MPEAVGPVELSTSAIARLLATDMREDLLAHRVRDPGATPSLGGLPTTLTKQLNY